LDLEEDKLLKMILLPQQVLDQEDMFQKQVPCHQVMLIFQDGLYQKREEQLMSVEDQIEIKHMILGQHSEHKLILKIQLVQNVILVQATDFKGIKQEHLKIKCKEDLVSSFLMPNGESKYTGNVIVTLSSKIDYKNINNYSSF
jgi:hypothetical protein